MYMIFFSKYKRVKIEFKLSRIIAVNILILNDNRPIITLRAFICKVIEISVQLWQFFSFTKKTK